MTTRATVSLVFGVDLPALEHEQTVADASDRSPTVALDYFTGEGVYGRWGAVLYARASETVMVRGYDVPVPVLDVARVGAMVASTAAWTEALRAFCMAHGLPWSAPKWMVASNVC